MANSRILLVEDDAPVRKFVLMALEDDDLDIVCCESVAQAVQRLQEERFDLVITDLMLVDGSGLAIVEQLAGRPARTLTVVFSAGVTQEIQARLASFGVTRILQKPVSVAALRNGVNSALKDPVTEIESHPSRPASQRLSEDSPAQKYFAGNVALYEAYRDSCRNQFGSDIQAGDKACREHDLQALRRLAHTLKTTFLLLGRESGSDVAEAADLAAAEGREGDAFDRWLELRVHLRKMAVETARA